MDMQRATNFVEWTLEYQPSHLVLKDGVLDLRLIQAPCGRKLVGRRLALQAHTIGEKATVQEIENCKEILADTRPDSLTVISYHPGLRDCEHELEEASKTRAIVGLGGNMGNGTNNAYIANGGVLRKKEKLSLSTDDLSFGLKAGKLLTIFRPDVQDIDRPVSWTVLNCHDYTHVDLIRALQSTQIELVVVVTYNAASRLFWEYAIADIHRLFCYVVVVNVAELGGSGVFAPFRQVGDEKHASLTLGGQIFGAKGPGSFSVDIPLEIRELRLLRAELAENGFDTEKSRKAPFGVYQAIMPSQHFVSTFDRDAGPPVVTEIVNHNVSWSFSNPRVAVAQLDSMSFEDYVETRYRISEHSDCRQFEHLLSVRLEELESRCRFQGANPRGSFLDLLVLPEVFVPRTYLRTLQGFSDRLGAIVIAGVDYPGTEDADNVNECLILTPKQPMISYEKICRSQYDAIGPNNTRMPMRRGSKLVRILDRDGRGFGILICCDYSHFDLLWELNLRDRDEPLDFLVVVAHNPFGSLYRSCCIADSHRFFQYILMCNVASYGGSGIFGPIRTKGARQVIAELGQGVEGIAVATLRLDELAQSRRTQDEQLHDGDFMRRPGAFQSRWADAAGGHVRLSDVTIDHG